MFHPQSAIGIVIHFPISKMTINLHSLLAEAIYTKMNGHSDHVRFLCMYKLFFFEAVYLLTVIGLWDRSGHCALKQLYYINL